MRLNADNVADYARTLTLQTRGGGVDLDFSADSIPLLETLFRNSDPLLSMPQLPERQRDLLVFYAGCYLGETLVRNLGGVWRFDDNWYESVVEVAAGEKRVEVRPFQKIYRRVTEGPEGNDLSAYVGELAALVERETSAP